VADTRDTNSSSSSHNTDSNRVEIHMLGTIRYVPFLSPSPSYLLPNTGTRRSGSRTRKLTISNRARRVHRLKEPLPPPPPVPQQELPQHKDPKLGRSTPLTGLRTGTMLMIPNVSYGLDHMLRANPLKCTDIPVQAWQASQYGQQGEAAAAQ
jgi:hypothetical protein